jgi:hypothetical protein
MRDFASAAFDASTSTVFTLSTLMGVFAESLNEIRKTNNDTKAKFFM